MPILSSDQEAALKAWLDAHAAGLDDAAAAEALNAPAAVANPTPRGQVPRPFTAIDLTGAIDPTRRAAIKPYLGDIRPDLDRQDARAIVGWALELQALGELEQADVDAVTALVTASDPDPAWPATVAGPSPWRAMFGETPVTEVQAAGPVTFIGHCSPAMVAEARGGA